VCYYQTYTENQLYAVNHWVEDKNDSSSATEMEGTNPKETTPYGWLHDGGIVNLYGHRCRWLIVFLF